MEDNKVGAVMAGRAAGAGVAFGRVGEVCQFDTVKVSQRNSLKLNLGFIKQAFFNCSARCTGDHST